MIIAAGLSISLKSTSILLTDCAGRVPEKKYQERLRRNWNATEITGGKLKNEKLNLSIAAEKDSKELPWQSTRAKLIWSQLQDNGGSYYDYEKISLSLKQDLILSSYNIEFTIGGAFAKYDQRLTENLKGLI